MSGPDASAPQGFLLRPLQSGWPFGRWWMVELSVCGKRRFESPYGKARAGRKGKTPIAVGLCPLREALSSDQLERGCQTASRRPRPTRPGGSCRGGHGSPDHRTCDPVRDPGRPPDECGDERAGAPVLGLGQGRLSLPGPPSGDRPTLAGNAARAARSLASAWRSWRSARRLPSEPLWSRSAHGSAPGP